MGREKRLHGDILRRGGMGHALGDELAQGRLVRMLELTPAAMREMAARGIDVVWPALQLTVGKDHVARHASRHMAAGRGDAVPLGRDAEDRFRAFLVDCAHRKDAKAGRTASASCPAVKDVPARCEAS